MSGAGATARMPGSALAWGSPVGRGRFKGSSAASSELARLASTLGSDQWAELSTNLVDEDMIIVGPTDGPCVQWGFCLAGYDPVSKVIPFVGGAHAEVPNTRHLIYTESTNAWSLGTPQSWWPQVNGQVMHSYCHNAMDPTDGQMYHHQFGSVDTHRWTVSTATWDDIADVTSNPDAPSTGAAYFPERGGLVLAGGGQVWFWTRSSNTWALEASSLDMGTHNNWAIYNPVRAEVLFGGGNDSPSIFTMSSAGTRTQKGDAPANLAVGNVYGTCDPTGGTYLFFDRNSNTEFVFRTYNAGTDTWSTRTMPDLGITVNVNAVILPAIVPIYGVIFMLVWNLSDPHVWIYKY